MPAKIMMLGVGVVAGAVVGTLVAVWMRHYPTMPQPSVVQTLHAGPTIEQIQSLASLVTTKVVVSDVVVTKLEGYTGGIQAAVLVKGDFLLGVDLSQARFESVDPKSQSATLIIPRPRVSSPRLDHERTRLIAVTDHGLWQIAPTDTAVTTAVMNLAMREAQRSVSEASNDPALFASSRKQAEKLLITFFRTIEWQLTIRWGN